MGDHYIPKFYLKGFEDPNRTDFIWVYREGNPPLTTSIKNIAQENKFYSREIEQLLANEVEYPANHVIQKIREQQDITQVEKLTLAKYMVVMWKRVPEHLQWTHDKGREMVSPLMEKLRGELEVLLAQYPDKEELIEKKINEFKNIPAERIDKMIHEMWLGNIPSEKTPQSIEALNHMTWKFMVANGEQYFITSDNPFFFFRWMGIGKEESEVSFPISKGIALWATWRLDIGEGYFRVGRQEVNEINRRTASTSTKSLYSPYSAKWIEKISNKPKNKIRLNRIV